MKDPRIAVVVSGTHDQFARLVESIHSGLYSRFGVYEFRSPAVYISQRPTEFDSAFESIVEEIATERVLPLYKLLRARVSPLYVDVPEQLWKVVDEAFSALLATLFQSGELNEALRASVYRGALTTFRIAVVLAVWRAYERGADLRNQPNVVALGHDVEAAVALGLVYSEHAIVQAVRLEKSLGLIPATDHVGGVFRMSSKEREYWGQLPVEFTTAQALDLANSLNIGRSTTFEWLRERWVHLLEQPRHGYYRKRSSSDFRTLGLSDFVDPSLDAPQTSAVGSPNGSGSIPLLEPENIVLTPNGIGTVVEVVSDTRVAVRVKEDFDGVQCFDISGVRLIQDFPSTDPGGP